jgi:heme-degrading monooxygenase HmoA
MAETYTSGAWVAKAGEEDDFVDAWREFAAWARTMPGCGTLRLVRDVEDAARFLSFAPWASFEAQRDWKETDAFRDRMMRVRRHTDEFIPSTYELVAVVE